MRLRYPALLGLLTASLLGCANDPAEPAPNPYAQAEALITQNLATYNNNVYLMVGKNGQTIYQKAWGSFTPTTQRNVASATKLVSGAVLLALQDRGTLSLNDSVGKYLTDWRGTPKGKITLRQLFAHTSGLPGDSPQGYENNFTITLAQAVTLIGQNVPLARPVGSGFEYGGVSMHVAGRVAEVASGKSWATLFSELIATPCQMTQSVYSPNILINPQIAGGLASTPADYLKFLEMLSGNGVFRGTRVLSQAAVDQLFADQRGTTNVVFTPYPLNAFTPYGTIQPVAYSVGAWLDVVQGNQVWEISSPGAFGTHPWVDRKNGIYGILFAYEQNGWANTGNITLQVRQVIRNAND